MTDATTKAIEKLSDQFRAFQVKEFPKSQRILGERIKGVETEVKGMNIRLANVEANGKNIVVQSAAPVREDVSTVVELPVPKTSSGAVGLNIPWRIVFRSLGIIALILLGLGFYIGNGNDMASLAATVNSMTTATKNLESQVKILSVPTGPPETYVNESSMMKTEDNQ